MNSSKKTSRRNKATGTQFRLKKTVRGQEKTNKQNLRVSEREEDNQDGHKTLVVVSKSMEADDGGRGS